MAGIYLHIPFCKKACTYCDFHFSTSTKYQDALIKAMVNEVHLRRNELNETIHSIYFGGGTPSLLNKQQLNQLLAAINSCFTVNENAEITLETNPDDMQAGKMEQWIEAGVNRLSVGIQSFTDCHLQWMNRTHTAQESLNCLNLAKKIGFEHFSIDLIYGLPKLSNQEWINTLQQAFTLNINHLSAYCLTLEANTAFHHQVNKGITQPLPDELQSEQFNILHEQLNAHGWEHYEISNACKPGNQALHNTAYWQGKPYLGIGPSAHSFNGENIRSWNIAHNTRYLKALEKNTRLFEQENLNTNNLYNEYLMTGLRTSRGVSLTEIQKKWGIDLLNEQKSHIERYQKKGWLRHQNNVLTLSASGWLFADHIASELFK